MMKVIMFSNIFILILTVLTQTIETPMHEQLEGQLENINNQIISYRRMGFLNQNFNNISQHFLTFSKPNIFDKMKIRKFVTTKIDVGEQMKDIKKMYAKQENQNSVTFQFDAKQRFLENMNFISTVALPSKKFQGLNFYSHIILQSFNKFYSLEGQNIFTFPLGDKIEDNVSKELLDSTQKLMIAYSRNENFYIAKYEEQYSVRYNADCLNVKISHVQMRNKYFSINTKLPYDNLKIETNACSKKDISETYHYDPYQFFFTYSTYHNKPSHYILANEKQIHFYLYSEIAQQLIMNQNKTIRLSQIWDDNTEKITTIIKLNTHLIILTNNNHLFSVNLMSHLSSKMQQNIIIYETLPLKFQKLHSIHFTDNDLRFFHVLSNRNIYLHKLSIEKIVKKYPLQTPICQNIHNLQKCTENIWILENYILVQQKEQRDQYNFDYQYFLVDKSLGDWHSFHIPFSHESKCSDLKKIFVTKNKNSHYIMTLVCFMQQKAKNKGPVDHDVDTDASNYLILQHLNLQTSNEMNNSGEIGGVDFTKFRVPMIVFSIGLVCYITLKRSSKKSPQKIVEEQKLNKKFEQEILSTIRREKQRQQALNIHKKKG